jgi:hypothetical protein
MTIQYWDTVVLPTWAVHALVNGEPLDDCDEQVLDRWLAKLEGLGVTEPTFEIVENEPHFTYWNELDDLGSDCYEVEIYKGV